MKKSLMPIIVAAALAFSLCACTSAEKEPEQVPDLLGEWKQTNSNSEDSYQAIYISEDAIEVYWVVESEDTAALYWAGSFTAPTDGKEPYKWSSKNDKSRTENAILASSDDIKQFTYEDGKISYSVAALGQMMTVEAEKQTWGYSDINAGSGGDVTEPNAGAGSGNVKMEGSGDIGGSHVEIKGAFLSQDYEGNPAIVVTYAWTNNSDETTSAMVATMEQAFQDGVELETAIITDDDRYDVDAGMKDVRPGTTIDVQCAFLLTSATSTVEFELSEWISLNDDMVTMDFDPASLS